jgi:Brp/Blh family beta-carotene 15,15'-monooxygenase
LISSLHFGRDWKYKISFGGFGYGAFVLGLPAWTFPEQVEQIIGFLIFENSASIPTILMQTVGLIGGFMLLVDRKKLSILRLAELSALAFVAFALEPLWYFVIYFCGFHSPRHLIAEFRTMKRETRFIAYIVMLLLTILTLGVAAVSGSHIEKYYESVDMVFYQVIFIGLAALTVPHMCLLEWAARQSRE